MLRDILDLSVGRPASESLRQTRYGESLFERLSNRSCLEAGLIAGYCTCANGMISMDNDQPSIRIMAETVLDDINQYLAENQMDHCMELTLKSLKEDDEKVIGPTLTLKLIPPSLSFRRPWGWVTRHSWCHFNVSWRREEQDSISMWAARLWRLRRTARWRWGDWTGTPPPPGKQHGAAPLILSFSWCFC